MNKKLLYAIGIPVALLILAFGYYSISPLFRNIEVNDIDPTLSGQVEEVVVAEQTEVAEQPTDVPTQNDSKASTPQTVTVKTTVATPPSTNKSTSPVPVIGTAGHPASGTARLIEVDGKKYIRYENFKTINGPDLFVYLAKDLDAKEFIDLGRVRATEGNINYEIESGVNTDEYPYVLIWCKAFGVLFNSAKLF